MNHPASRRHRSRRPGIQAPTPKSHNAEAPKATFNRYQNVPPLQPPYPLASNLHSPTPQYSGNLARNPSTSKDSRRITEPMAGLSPTPGVPSPPSRERLHRRQRSHPFLNLTFTALHESPSLPSGESGLQPKSSSQPTRGGATGSSSTSGFGSSALVTGYDNDTSSQERKTKRTSSSGSLSNLPNFSSGTRRPARSLPSSPGPARRPLPGQQNSSYDGLDPRKEYFFTPSSTPIVLPPVSSPDPLAPRMRKRSTGAKSAPTSPVNSLTPVGSRMDLVAYAEKARLARSGSVGEAMHALKNQQWVGQPSRAGGEFPAGGHFFPSRPRQNIAEAQYASPDEESQDEADAVSFAGRKASGGSRRSRSNPAGGALDIMVDATPALSRRQSEATLRAHSIQTTPQPDQVEEAVPLPATTSTDSETDQKTVSILYSLRYLAAIPVIQTAVTNLRLALFATASVNRTHHGLICLWTIVTAVALVNLTTDLLRRWLYNCRYPPFPHILIRLLALQLGILFPSIHLGLAMLHPSSADKVSNQAVAAWCFLATAITMIGEAARPWTNVAGSEAAAENDSVFAEKPKDPILTTNEPQPHKNPLRFHSTRLRNSVGGPLFPTIFAYFATSWVLLLTEGFKSGL